jgi:hypothetical protein
MPVADWFIHSEIYARGSLVYTQWNICQWRIGLYSDISQWRFRLYIMEYMPVAYWFIHSGTYASGDLVYT